MNEIQYIYDVTSETFETDVVARSQQVPVLVDFWADWCGPCQMQMPVLKKLVDEYAGKFQLAKVNTDEQRELARTHGIRSLPTMRLYRHGAVVEEILGAQTESALRILLDRYIERESDRVRAQARSLLDAGNQEAALELLENLHREEEDNHQITLNLAETCFAAGRMERAADLLAELPRDVRDEREATRLLALLDFAGIARDAPPLVELEAALQANPDDIGLRYRYGSAAVLADQPDIALEQFLAVLQRDRGWRDGAGRKALLAMFDLLGDADARVADYRRRMFNILH